MSNKCLIFSDLVPVMHIKSHAVTSGNCCVSSVVTSSCMTPINEIITDFSKHTRYPAGYSVSSLHTQKIRKVCKTFRQFGPISALLYNNLWCSSLSPNEDAVKMLEREVHHIWGQRWTCLKHQSGNTWSLNSGTLLHLQTRTLIVSLPLTYWLKQLPNRSHRKNLYID